MSYHIVHRVNVQVLKDFCVQAFQKAGVAKEDACITADILVAADLRGVTSHGVAQLRRYVEGLFAGTIAAHPDERVLNETPVMAVIDAGSGMGQAVSYRAMQMAIQKARKSGIGFVSVRNSNHHGMLGYYAMMALPYDCIGLTMTNASTKVVPTFGLNAILGTNPLSIAAPAGKQHPFVLDMATSAVAFGKIETADRLGKPIPEGWAIDMNGNPAIDSHKTVDEFKRNLGGGLLPLGGAGELFGGHKGYGLAMSVEIFTALLSGSAISPLTYPKTPEGKQLPANVGHFFGAWKIDCFQPIEEFKATMDNYQQMLKNTPKVNGQERIYIPGEKEYEAAEKNMREGIPIYDKVEADLRKLAQTLKIEWIRSAASL
jgi:LDH2 family malate/lactate/ureidoglycolate dehydrogenase